MGLLGRLRKLREFPMYHSAVARAEAAQAHGDWETAIDRLGRRHALARHHQRVHGTTRQRPRVFEDREEMEVLFTFLAERYERSLRSVATERTPR